MKKESKVLLFATIAALCVFIGCIVVVVTSKKNVDEPEVFEHVTDNHRGMYEDEDINKYADRTREVATKDLAVTDYIDVDGLEPDVEEPVEDPNNFTNDIPAVALDHLGGQVDALFGYAQEMGLTEASQYSVDECNLVNDSCIVYVRLLNTDVVGIYEVNVNTGELVMPIDYPIVRYGSDYSPIYFRNGVPDNSEKIYEALLNDEIFGVFTTDYAEGSVVDLVDVSSGEHVAISLEE